MRIWVTDRVHPLLPDGLRERGHQVQYDPHVSLQEVRDKIPGWDGIIVNSKIIMDRGMLDRAQNLRFIGRLGSGLDIIDLQLTGERGIEVIRSPEGNRNAVAEHCLGMLLSLFNHLCRADRQVRQGIWDREANRGRELAGSTVGIIGYGNNGKAFADKLSGMDVEILSYDKYKQGFGTAQVKEVKLEELLDRSEIVSLHIPLTEETRQMVDRRFLEKCQPDVIFMNISRGEIVRTADLLDALKSGRVAGACLDVLESEQPTEYTRQEKTLYEELFALEHVILTPHVAGWTVESKQRIAEVLLKKIISFSRKRNLN